jgi:transcriptional regulator with XRE-family HTH domain
VRLSTVLRRVGENLRKARWLVGLTQEETASRVKTTVAYYKLLERGATNPTVATLHRLATKLDVAMSELVDVGDRPAPQRRLSEIQAQAPKRGPKPKQRRRDR